MTNSQILRAQHHSLNQSDNKNSKQSNVISNNDKASRASKNSVAQQQPHPSIFDIKQESSYAQMKAKVPVLADNVEYFNYSSEHVSPKGRPLFGCKFKLIEHDDLSPKTRQYYCDAISEAGGLFEENIDNLTHLICESQSSPLFANAVRRGVRCVTIYWINDVLGQDRLEYPWRALHIPACYSKDDKHLRDQIISITNLKKQDRRYVKDMIKKTGAKYTDYFSRKNTLLICGSPTGEKFDRAIEWGIPIANCLLISDYLISGRKFDQMLNHAKYQNFNRGDQLKLDSYDLIKELMIPWTKPIPAIVEKPSSNGMVKEMLPSETSKIDTAPVLGSNKDTDTNDLQPEKLANSEKDEVDVDQNNEQAVQKEDLKISSSLQPQADKLIVGEKYSVIDTSDMSANINTSGQTEPSVLDQPNSTIQKDAAEEVQKEANHDGEKAEQLVARRSATPVRVLFTRLKPTLHAQLEKYAIDLGFTLAPSSVDCTHLVVEKISRSPKFICAINHADFVLSYRWLIDSHNFGKPLDEMAYILQDKEGEKNYCFNLVHSMMKRKKRGHLLFRDFIFFVTPTPLNAVTNLTEMIMSAGGSVSRKKLPTADQIFQLRSEGKRFVVIADKQDLYLLDSIEAFGVDIVDFEFVLCGILRQDLDLDHHRLNISVANGRQKEITNTVQPSPQKKIRHN